MKRDHSSGDFEKDPVWDLLRQTAAHRPGPNFAADVVRAARMQPPAKPWWSRLLIPASVGSVLAGAAALVTVMLTLQSNPTGESPMIAHNPPADVTWTDLQDDAETEVFLTAAEHLSDYSDEELASMMGF